MSSVSTVILYRRITTFGPKYSRSKSEMTEWRVLNVKYEDIDTQLIKTLQKKFSRKSSA